MDDAEVVFWGAIKTGLVTYTEASQMYMWELEEVFNAAIFLENLKAEAINEVINK